MVTIDNLPDYVRHAILDGASRIVCPVCGGGSSKEASLSIRPLDDGIIQKLSCWRATCGYWSYVGTGKVKIAGNRPKTARVYKDDMMAIQDLKDTLVQAYGLDPAVYGPHGWAESPMGDTLIMPVRDSYGRVRGHVTRTFDTPKRCMTWKATSLPWLDWWLVSDSAPVVVVEDALSACRLAGCGINACALLGTSMTTEQAEEIARVADERAVFLALDNDAFDKAIKLKRRHAHILPALVGVVLLTKDIKNIDNDDDIRSMFNGRAEFDCSDLQKSGRS